MSDIKQRIYGLDLIRLLVIVPDVCYNSSELLDVPEKILLQDTKLFFPLISYIRLLYFAGFISMFVAFFILGLKADRKVWTLKRFLIAVPGTLIVTCVYQQNYTNIFELDWEFYHLIIVGLTAVSLIRMFRESSKAILAIAIVSLIGLAIPFWEFSFFYKLPVNPLTVLVGDCRNMMDGAWPILPWIFLISFAYSWAIYLKNYFSSNVMNKLELSFWIALLLLSVFNWGAYYILPSDFRYTCSLFRNGPINFFSNMMPIFFFTRISFLDNINYILSKNKFVLFLGKMKWIDQFGQSYMLSFLVIGALSVFFPLGNSVHEMQRDFVIVSLLGFFGTEIVLRMLTQKKSKAN